MNTPNAKISAVMISRSRTALLQASLLSSVAVAAIVFGGQATAAQGYLICPTQSTPTPAGGNGGATSGQTAGVGGKYCVPGTNGSINSTNGSGGGGGGANAAGGRGFGYGGDGGAGGSDGIFSFTGGAGAGGTLTNSFGGSGSKGGDAGTGGSGIGRSGGGGGAGGFGALLSGSGQFSAPTNIGLRGGAGGTGGGPFNGSGYGYGYGYGTGNGGNGGDGGVGVYVSGGASLTIAASGSGYGYGYGITGGDGGAGGLAYTGSGGNGGNGAAGVFIANGSTLNSSGRITGGANGRGGYSENGPAGQAGLAGAGIVSQQTGTVNITGGSVNGGALRANSATNLGTAGAGIYFAQGGTLNVSGANTRIYGGYAFSPRLGKQYTSSVGGGAGGAGVVFTQSGALSNVDATIGGGYGGPANNRSSSLVTSGAGGVGVSLGAGGSIANSGTGKIYGGGGGGFSSFFGYGYASALSLGGGGAAILVSNGGSVSNSGSGLIKGGYGGAGYGGGQGYSYTSNIKAGAGGTGISLLNGGMISNSGAGQISGGDGGYSQGYGGIGGAGGAGISLLNGGSVTNSDTGKITGGKGGYGGYLNGGATMLNGAGGTGIIATGATITNNAGATIAGGKGGESSYFGKRRVFGSYSNTGGAGGGGVNATNSTITNAGTIMGGQGARSYQSENGPSIFAPGGVAITGSNLIVINSGTISGGLPGNSENGPTLVTAPTTYANAVQFTGGVNRLTLLAGYVINGQVVAYSGADTLELSGSTNATFDVSKIAPTGSSSQQYQNFGIFQKTGTSTWTLTNTTTALTPWTVLGGTLAVASDGALGAAAGLLTLNGGALENTASFTTSRPIALGANGGTFNTDPSTNLTLTGSLTGAGSLNKIGTGTLTLAGSASYTGATNVNAGTLRGAATNAFSANSALTIASGATVDLGGFGQTVAALSGAGAITNSGSAAAGLTTGGNNASTTFSGVISDGTSKTSLTKTGTGTLTLSGANTFSGGTTIQNGGVTATNASAFGSGAIVLKVGGTLTYGGSFTLANNISLPGTLDPTIDTGANNAVESGVISGSGALTKAGSGTLTLTGQSTLTGATTVAAGTLIVNGALGSSAVTVNSGTTIGGSGTIGGLIALSGATVAPGTVTPFSTLGVNGNVNFQAGSIFNVNINAAGQTDAISATGTATIGGGAVNVNASTGTYNPASRYVLVTANGGVTGTFASLTTTTNLAFLTPTLAYDARTVALRFVQNAVTFPSVAGTPNQRAAGAAIQSLGGGAVYNAVLSQSVAGARQAFDATSGEIHASAITTLFEDNRFVREAILDRLYNASQGYEPATAATPARTIISKDGPNRKIAAVPAAPVTPYAFWGQALGDWGHNDGNGNAAKLTRSIGGVILGGDVAVNQSPWRIGGAVGYTYDSINVSARNSSGKVSSIYGALYTGATFGAVDLRAGVSYAGTHTSTNRTIAFSNFADATSAGYDGQAFQAFGEVGYKIALAQGVIEPFLGAAAIHVHQNSFRENGGAARLNAGGRSADLETTTLGVRGELKPIADVPLTLRGLLGWRHAYGAVNPSTVLSFASGSTAFTVYGAPIARDAAMVETALDYRATEAVTVGLTYSGQLSSKAQDHAIKGNVLYKF